LPVDKNDIEADTTCSHELQALVEKGSIKLPDLALEEGHNTRQAMNYKFSNWRDFFNDRQLLGLGQLYSSIHELEDAEARDSLATLFSGALEFNNLFASYKGEGTGAVRHMFSHHILKPERTPIEANIWGTPKISGSFSNLFRGRLLRAIDYREYPTELNGTNGQNRICSLPFTGIVADRWPNEAFSMGRDIFLSCGDSASTGLPDASIDFVVTDPPFFDNVHYSELADFFHAWHQLYPRDITPSVPTTRNVYEVQDADSEQFSAKLERVFCEARRVLKDSGLLVFTYHHSREEGWHSLAAAILNAGFIVVNSHPVKAEMSVATPKSQAKEPINFDIVLVCRKSLKPSECALPTEQEAIKRARAKLIQLQKSGFELSRNDRKIALYGQLLTTIETAADIDGLGSQVDDELSSPIVEVPTFSRRCSQGVLFNDMDC
jgi:putative DNA methylase